MRGDLIETFKILKGFYDSATTKDLFTLSNDDGLRGHGLKLKVKRSNTNLSLNLFTNRMTKTRNSLPSDIISSETLNAFKNSIDKHFKSNIYRQNLSF